MLLRKRMGSKKLLLKQKEVAEAFASGRDAFFSFATSYSSTFATDAMEVGVNSCLADLIVTESVSIDTAIILYLYHSHRLRIMTLLGSGCKTTFEGLPDVQRSSITQTWQSYLSDSNYTCRVGKIQRIVISVSLFHYSVFRVLPTPFCHSQPLITSLGVAEIVFLSQQKRLLVYIIITSRCWKLLIRFANFASKGSMASLALT